jgi:hypothetical protein
MTLDTLLRSHIYRMTLERGLPPTVAELASATSASADDVRAALRQLQSAPPFSAVPTPFLVKTSRHAAYANCAWDALGVPVMLRDSARIISACACCGDSITLDINDDVLMHAAAMVHFAVPAMRWWEDIVFT